MKSNTYPRDAADFLETILAARPAPKKLIDKHAAMHKFSADQLYRAKKKLGIVTSKQRGTMTGGWSWALPQHTPKI
jgi:hypothetical protein